MNVFEAFRALEALNEDTFSINDDGIKKLSDFENQDDLQDDISVIDPEAETEEDIKDSYVGIGYDIFSPPGRVRISENSA